MAAAKGILIPGPEIDAAKQADLDAKTALIAQA